LTLILEYVMPISLTQSLDDTVISTQEKKFLKDLQANILKGHGREHVALLFLAVNDVSKARQFLHHFPVSSAFTQLEEARQYKATRAPGGVVRLAFLSHAGLSLFGHGPKFAAFGLFAGGMAADSAVLDAGSTSSWQNELKQPVHAMLLVAYHDETDFTRIVGRLMGDLEQPASGFDVTFVQEGRAYKNADGQGIEHFGYVDGRSQPLMLESDLQAEPRTVYDPASPLGQFILQDPLHNTSFGSFFVFRKLEQNVAGFKQAEDALADKMELIGADKERAGAQVVGRFEDGTPVTLRASENGIPVLNDFDYSADASAKCPFHGHIRKSNPRGSSPGGLAFDKGVQMARRGITYGCRLQDADSKEFIDQPNDGVGLLFMSYQAAIDKQFHFMQTQWVNSEGFPKAGVGIDPVIGQGPSTLPQTWPPTFGSAAGGVPSLFRGFVTLRGGEYFYTPSISGLKAL
jgi:Dyp-type peroxidase family